MVRALRGALDVLSYDVLGQERCGVDAITGRCSPYFSAISSETSFQISRIQRRRDKSLARVLHEKREYHLCSSIRYEKVLR